MTATTLNVHPAESAEAAAQRADSAADATPDLESVAAALRPSLVGRCRESLSATRDAAQMLGLSAALWVLYVPHYVMLRMLGPRLGMAWVRLAAHVHWMLTFVGAQRAARQALRSMHPYFQTRMSASQILRRHLLLKHECFARVRVYSLHAAQDDPHAFQWRCHPECVSAIPTRERKRGMIIVGYHFNFFQSFAAGLAHFFPGVNLVQLRYRSWRCVEKAASPITRLALKKAMEADRRAGATVFYIDDMEALVQLYRLLRQSGVVAVTADGGAAGEFVDVPFFDGTFRAPSGWAKLAAATKSDVLLICDRDVDGTTRDGMFFNHVTCPDATNESAYAAVAESIRVLERMIREEPWGWHPWQRLRVDVGADGVRRYSLKQYGFNEGKRLNGRAPAKGAQRLAAQPGSADSGMPAVRQRPRVAVVANSYPPYRVHLHQQIVAQAPEVELWSLSTHSNSYCRWDGLRPPEAIRPVEFSAGEPTNEQPHVRRSMREWRKGGRVIRWLREHEVAAVFVQGCGDMGRLRIIHWCRRHGVPCFLTGDFNIRSDNHRPLKRWLKRLVYNRGVGWSYGLMPCGEHGLALLHRYGGRDKPEWRFPFVPDVSLFQRTPPEAIHRARAQYSLDPARRRLVFSARMMSAKRPDLAIAAFARIAADRPQWDLVMVGDGPLRAELESAVPVPLRGRVTWTGFLDRTEDIAAIYAQCDAMLLPSDHEPWGVVIVEAAAAGLAIVASDAVGAGPELVHHGENGGVFPIGDLDALVRELLATTAADAIETRKARSLQIMHQWLSVCDPVGSFRKALVHCGVLSPGGQSPGDGPRTGQTGVHAAQRANGAGAAWPQEAAAEPNHTVAR
ncbi:MAG TPA: glycosyltransferase [Lacipirellulaceae bacterium]|nr:glycosyltransferase [Lacipirellulaceae bacterium]